MGDARASWDKNVQVQKKKKNQNGECLSALNFNKGRGGDSLSKPSCSSYYYYATVAAAMNLSRPSSYYKKMKKKILFF
jgi:hypothetical protein